MSEALLQSLAYFKRLPLEKKFYFGEDHYTSSHIIRSLELFSEFVKKKPSRGELSSFIKSNYFIYKSQGASKKSEVLFTGYYEPILEGSIDKRGDYKYPIYALPNDLITIELSQFSDKFKGQKIIARYDGKSVLPYYDRLEIDYKGVISDNANVLAWLKDPVDLFFLHIQGSGIINLLNGGTIRVHYHAANGRPYRSIGNLLIQDGKIPKSEMSMQAIKKYLNEHPEEIPMVLSYNQSYVFFKIEKDGPLGCIDVKLIPHRAIALDQKKYPSGSLAFIMTQKPLINESGNIYKWVNFGRFVLNQDTGGAIQGAGRADLFFGNGRDSEIAAGNMKHKGELYFIIMKDI
ncbi:MAG: MltA domain-containing protein [Desulfobacterales bacterium]|nr:MltA domain-containing protein [Desulfobacterales bacterium]